MGTGGGALAGHRRQDISGLLRGARRPAPPRSRGATRAAAAALALGALAAMPAAVGTW